MRALPCSVGIAAVAAAAVSGCAEEAPTGMFLADSAGVRIVQHQVGEPPRQLVTAAERALRRVGGYDAASGEEISEVFGRAALAGHHVFVADAMSHNIRRFDLDGDRSEVIGQQGEGPGEFLLPTVVGTLGADSVVVYDAQLRRVSILTGTGEYVRSFSVPPQVRPPFAGAGVLGDGSVVFTGAMGLRLEGRQRVAQDTVPVVALGPEGEFRSEFGAFPAKAYFEGPANHRPRALELAFSPGAPIVAGAAGVYVGSTDDFEVRRFDASGVLSSIIRIAIAKAPILASDRDSIMRWELSAASSEASEGVRALFGAMPIPAFKPPIQQLAVDPAGRLWVQVNSTEPILDTWFVFDDAGVLLGSADLPDGHVIYIDGRYVVLLTTDEHHAQVVSVFELVNARSSA